MKEFDIFEMATGNLTRVVAIRLKPGADVLLGLEEAVRYAGINNGVILSALGSLDGVKYCNPEPIEDSPSGWGYGPELEMRGGIELLGLSGVICHDAQGEINLHVHITMSDVHGNCRGGHLVQGTKVLLTVDVVIAEIGDGLIMGRDFDADLGVPIFKPRQE